MPSVARRIRALLEARLLTINGTGEMVYDVGSNVFGYRPTLDTEIEAMPAVFIFRREGGEERNGTPDDTCIDKVVIYDVVGIVPAGPGSGDAAEDLLADFERALERPADLYLADAGAELLSEPLVLTPSEFSLGDDASKVESVAVGVRCRYPHIYGDPEYVPL